MQRRAALPQQVRLFAWAFDQQIDLSPNPLAFLSRRNLLLQLHQLTPASLNRAVGNLARRVIPIRRSPLLVRVGEDTEPVDFGSGNELAKLLKVGLGLAREANNKARTNHHARNDAPRLLNQLKKDLRVASALHCLQHAGAGVLERHVQILGDGRMLRHRLEQARRNLVRIGVEKPQPAQAGQFSKAVEQLCKPFFQPQVFAVARRVLANQRNLANALRNQVLRLRDDRAHAARAELAAKLRDNAEAARMVAAFGNLDVRAGAGRGQDARRRIVIQVFRQRRRRTIPGLAGKASGLLPRDALSAKHDFTAPRACSRQVCNVLAGVGERLIAMRRSGLRKRLHDAQLRRNFQVMLRVGERPRTLADGARRAAHKQLRVNVLAGFERDRRLVDRHTSKQFKIVLRVRVDRRLPKILRKNLKRRTPSGVSGGREARSGKNSLKLPRADDRIYLRNVLADLVPISLHKTACDHDPLRLAAMRLLMLHHLENGIDRLLLRRIDEAARVDHDDLGIFRTRGQLGPIVMEQTHHHFAIDQVLRASERDEAHLGSRGRSYNVVNFSNRHQPSFYFFAASRLSYRAIVWSAMASHANFSSTRFRPASPIRLARSGSASRSVMG